MESSAPDPDGVPQSIRHHVRIQGVGWRIELPRTDYLYAVIATGVGASLAFFLGPLVFWLVAAVAQAMLDIGPALVLAMLFGVGTAVMSVLIPVAITLAFGTAEVMTLEAHRVVCSSRHWDGRRADRITVRGLPGGSTTVDVGAHRIWTFREEDAEDGWDHHAVTWLVGEMARIWEQPLDDERDLAAFDAFATDPLVRAQVEWRRELQANREAYPAFHDLPPVEPHHNADLDGLTVELFTRRTHRHTVRLTGDTLEVAGESIPLITIDDVRLTIGEQEDAGNHTHVWHVTLAVLVGRSMRVVSLASIDEQLGRRIGEHRWMRDRIMAAARGARAAEARESGDVDEVPEALRRLRGSTNARRQGEG